MDDQRASGGHNVPDIIEDVRFLKEQLNELFNSKMIRRY